MSNVKYIKRINKFGVNKLVRNAQSLQQILTNIAAIHEKGLDKVIEYFNLISMSGEVTVFVGIYFSLTY